MPPLPLPARGARGTARGEKAERGFPVSHAGGGKGVTMAAHAQERGFPVPQPSYAGGGKGVTIFHPSYGSVANGGV